MVEIAVIYISRHLTKLVDLDVDEKFFKFTVYTRNSTNSSFLMNSL